MATACMATVLTCLTNPFSSTKNLGIFPLRRSFDGCPTALHIHCSVTTKNSSLSKAGRRSANYQPSVWSYEYMQSLKNDHLAETYKDKATKLEADVRSMITDGKEDIISVLNLIDNVQRLGLEYRFQTEIRQALDRFVSLGGLDANSDLQANALSFRLLREYGYEVSQDVFSKFKDENGNFKECLKEDIKAMLSLYEASYLGFEGESFLDEANEFARLHLKNLGENLSEDLVQQVRHGLELPLHRRTQRLEALWSIEAYGRREDTNQTLLELAIIDFNMVQSIYQRELRGLSSWWRSMDLANNLTFARDRLMECFFWAVGIVPEPQHSNCRTGLTKVVAFITLIDDMYDVYGTLEELELFTDVVQRWDVNAINDLPDYMKLCFLSLYNTINEMAYEILKVKGQYVLPSLRKAWAHMCKSFLQEAKWFYNKSTPSFKNYIENAWISVSGPLQLVHANVLLNDGITKQELESSEKYHDLLRFPAAIFRLCNDLATAPAELERGETVTSIACYMKENDVAEEVAKEDMRKMIDGIWKKMNQERVEESVFTKSFMEAAFNIARISHCHYEHGDAHSSPDERSRKRVLQVIIDPVSPRGKQGNYLI